MYSHEKPDDLLVTQESSLTLRGRPPFWTSHTAWIYHGLKAWLNRIVFPFPDKSKAIISLLPKGCANVLARKAWRFTGYPLYGAGKWFDTPRLSTSLNVPHGMNLWWPQNLDEHALRLMKKFGLSIGEFSFSLFPDVLLPSVFLAKCAHCSRFDPPRQTITLLLFLARVLARFHHFFYSRRFLCSLN